VKETCEGHSLGANCHFNNITGGFASRRLDGTGTRFFHSNLIVLRPMTIQASRCNLLIELLRYQALEVNVPTSLVYIDWKVKPELVLQYELMGGCLHVNTMFPLSDLRPLIGSARSIANLSAHLYNLPE